ARGGATNALDNVTGKGADICTPMAAYLSFVAHASERDAHKLAVHGIGNRTSKGRLAHTWRSDETQNRGFALRFQLEHSEVFENSFFNFFQIVMITFENLTSLDDIDFLGRKEIPWQGHKPIQISARDGIFRGSRRHASQASQLALGFFLRLFGHAVGLDLFSKFFDFALRVVAFTELSLNRSELFPQEVLALAFPDLLLDLALNLAA